MLFYARVISAGVYIHTQIQSQTNAYPNRSHPPLRLRDLDANNRLTEEDQSRGNEMLPPPFAHLIERPHHKLNSVQKTQLVSISTAVREQPNTVPSKMAEDCRRCQQWCPYGPGGFGTQDRTRNFFVACKHKAYELFKNRVLGPTHQQPHRASLWSNQYCKVCRVN